MANVPAKIVLKSTTKMSLNDRFSHIQKIQKPAEQATVENMRAKMVAQQQATAANRRLAMQMGNRPSVQAALNPNAPSLKQRLGVKGRLGGSAVNGRGRGGFAQGRGVTRGLRRGRGMARGRLGAVDMTGQVQQQGRGKGFRRGGRGAGGDMNGAVRGTKTTRGGYVQNRGTRRGRGGQTQRGGFRGRGQNQGWQDYNRGGFRGRGGVRGQGQANPRGRGGFQRGGRGGRGGRGRGRGGQGPAPSKEDLDNQLDAYMSKTKNNLDAELDAYMAQSDL